MTKTGLVLEGGGVRGAYTAGALKWLSDNDIRFDYSVGISSGAFYLALHLAGQDEASKLLATRYVIDPKVVGVSAFLRTGYFVDYDLLFNKFVPECHASIQSLIDSDIDCEVGVYDLSEGKTAYIHARDFDLKMDVLRAACSLPIVSKAVEWKGKRFLDGGIRDMIPIERALFNQCDKFLVITTKPKDYVRKPTPKLVRMIMKNMYKECPQAAKDYAVRDENYYKEKAIIQDLIDQQTAINVFPSKTIEVSRWKGDPVKCDILYELGYQDMENRKEEILQLLER